MSGSKAKLEIKDLIEELMDENNRLLNELKLTQKLFKLFENYRNFFVHYSNQCKCNPNIGSNDVFIELELQYKQIFCEINNRVEDKNRSEVRPILRTINKNLRKTKPNEVINKGTDNNQCLETFDTFEDNIVCKNKLKRNQRNDFIDPKPLFSVSHQMEGSVIKGNRLKSKPIVGYLCQYLNCNYQNSDKGNVSRHISKMHLNKTPLICSECQQTFWGQKRLFDHKKCFHFPNLLYNVNRKTYECDYNDCKYETKSLTNLTQHLRRHSGEKPFQCVDCFSCFVTKSELKTHIINIHSNDRPFLCLWEGCHQSFKTKERLNWHSYGHTGLFPYPCSWPGCEAKYVKQAELKLHQLSHLDEYPFLCEWPGCKSKFKTKSSRRLHNFTHTGERPFKCEWPGCESSYYMKSKLNRHKQTHNGLKRYVCDWPQCDKKYSTSHNLKLHLMAHRDERPYVCPHCQRRFAVNSQLKRHSLKVHKTIIL